MKALLISFLLSLSLSPTTSYTGNVPPLYNKFVEPLDTPDISQPGYDQFWLPVRTHMQNIGDLVEIELRCEDRTLLSSAGNSKNPWRGYKMSWEIWRHDGPNPGWVDPQDDPNNSADWQHSDDNNPYYVDLVGPYGEDGICKQRLRVLAFESSYVRI